MRETIVRVRLKLLNVFGTKKAFQNISPRSNVRTPSSNADLQRTEQAAQRESGEERERLLGCVCVREREREAVLGWVCERETESIKGEVFNEEKLEKR